MVKAPQDPKVFTQQQLVQPCHLFFCLFVCFTFDLPEFCEDEEVAGENNRPFSRECNSKNQNGHKLLLALVESYCCFISAKSENKKILKVRHCSLYSLFLLPHN